MLIVFLFLMVLFYGLTAISIYITIVFTMDNSWYAPCGIISTGICVVGSIMITLNYISTLNN